jgi:phosphate:Na+ symporter
MDHEHLARGVLSKRFWVWPAVFIVASLGAISWPREVGAPRAGSSRAEFVSAAAADPGGVQPPTIESRSSGPSKPDDRAASSAQERAASGVDESKGGAETDGKSSLDWFTMSMSALAGLVLFIYGVTQLAQGLGDLNSERMRRVTARFTSNRLAGVATGFAATTLLESSSVTIIMVIAMVSGGVLTFVQSMGVVLGANIGTAVGAQIIALDVERYVPILMVSGLLLMFVGKSETRRKLGLVVLGFGLMFYGLEAIDEAMKPLRDHEAFMHAMTTMGTNPILGAAFGAVFTMIIQSSSATVAIVITLAGSGLISLPTGVAIMLGAEIGTCSDTLLATIGRGRPALRTGVFHLVFNLASACIGVALAPLFVQFIESISGEAGVGRKIAHAQMIFNCAGVAIALPFLPAIARLLERVLPERARAEMAQAPPTAATAE